MEEKRIEILVNSPEAAESLVSLITSDAVKEMFAKIGGEIRGIGIFAADAGLDVEEDDELAREDGTDD